jgi:hypothetical protein
MAAPCKCGCGQKPPRGRWYVPGHRVAKLTDRKGYRLLWCPGHPMARANGCAQAHRVILYDAGVDIPAGHVVHHKNGDKQDNRLENLEVLTPGEHSLLHMLERGYCTTQHGTFPVLADPEERRQRDNARQRANQAYNTEWKRKRRAELRGAKS